jgi:hypothetical protein
LKIGDEAEALPTRTRSMLIAKRVNPNCRHFPTIFKMSPLSL